MKLEKVYKKVEAFTKDQILKREARLNNPAFKLKMEEIKKGCENDLKNISKNALNFAYHILYGMFIKSTLESFKDPKKKIKGKKNKKESNIAEMLGNGIGVGLMEGAKGGIDAIKLIANTAKLTGRTTILGTRYLIGY